MFEESQRKIFRADVDGVESKFDPTEVWRNLYAALDGTELGDLIKQAESEVVPIRLAAYGRIAECSRKAFRLGKIDEDRGVTEVESMEILYAFFAWEADLKNALERTPNGAGPSTPSPVSSTTSVGTASG